MYLPVGVRVSRQKAKFPFSMHVFQEKMPRHSWVSSVSSNLIKKMPHRSCPGACALVDSRCDHIDRRDWQSNRTKVVSVSVICLFVLFISPLCSILKISESLSFG